LRLNERHYGVLQGLNKSEMAERYGEKQVLLWKRGYDISDKDIVELNIPTGIPLVYKLDTDLKPVTHYYLGDEEEVKKAKIHVAEQGKLKTDLVR